MITDTFKILSDQTRLRILLLLHQHDLCVCELVQIMEEVQPKISKHIAKIRNANLVLTKQNEQFVYYSINPDQSLLLELVAIIHPILQPQEPYRTDTMRLHDVSSFACQENR